MDHASANEKFDWGIFGASVLVGKKTKGGEGWRRSERILFLINCELRNVYSTSLKPMHACALFSHSLGNEEE
jgi:hypothetical protein